MNTEETTTPTGKKLCQTTPRKPRSEPPRTRATTRTKAYFNLERRQLAEILIADEESDNESETTEIAAEMAENSPQRTRPPTADEFRNILREGLANVAKKEDLENVMERVDRNTNAITTMNLRMTNIEGQISSFNSKQDAKLVDLEEKLTQEHRPSGVNRSSREAAYDKARRSLRVWPIKGDDVGELETNFRDFCLEALMVTQETIDVTVLDGIIRVRNAPSNRIYLKICVTFQTTEERDFFSSKARNLAAYRDEDGKPEAGIRMDIPPFLLSTFKLLNDHGYDIRDVHGKETKCYVKFDEEKLSLILEVRLPHTTTVSYTHLTLPTTPYV